jgi:SWI/SNF-related matrix-associated actin-dependent regulator 1 of chromatin subfamily A
MASVLFHPYQREGIVRAYHALQDPQARGGFYLQWKPGMGKSLGAIALHRHLKSQRTVIVCPVVAQGVWRREFEKWLPGQVISDDVTDDAHVVITTYDRLKDPKASNVVQQRRTGSARLHKLQAWNPTLLILDEAQYIKSPSAARTRAMWKLAAACQYKLLLSGTPAHSPLDWWSQFRVIAPHEDVFRQTYSDYKQSTVVLTQGPNGAYPMRGRNGALVVKQDGFARLTNAMAPYVHAVPKSVLNLPEPIVTDVPVTLGPKERKAYTQMETMLRAELTDAIGNVTEANATIVLTKIMRLTQIAAGHVTNEVGDTVAIGTAKLDAALGLLEEYEDEKVVIACRFRQDIANLEAALAKQGRPCRKIDGGVSGTQRTAAEDWFQQGDHNGVMLLQYQAGGVAITLTAASAIILYTLTPSVIQWEQTISRVHRIGTTTNVNVLYLIAMQTQDEIMQAALQRGASTVDMCRLLLKYLNRVDGQPEAVA